MSIYLLENTVDIASTVNFSKKSVEIDRHCGFIPKKILVDIDRRCVLIPKTIGRQLISTVEVDMDSKKSWTLTLLTLTYFITKRCIWLTQTLTSVHPDPFQALLTKQHATKKPTHTDKVHNGHRVARPPGLLGTTSQVRFLVWRFKRLAFGPGRVFPRSQTIDPWSHMVP